MEKKWSLATIICIWVLLLPAWATEEKPAIGIAGGAREIMQGQGVQLLISHASYPRLEDFKVTAECRSVYGIQGKTTELGHPDDNGKLNWTPQESGSCRIRAEAPNPVAAGQMVVIEQTFVVRSNHFEANPLLLLGFIAVTLLLLLIFWWLRKKKA